MIMTSQIQEKNEEANFCPEMLDSDITNFNWINSINLLSGGTSGNIYKLNYKRDEYKVAYTLKTSNGQDTDSLFYEAYVGLGINKLSKYVPIFVKTYGCYIIKDKTAFSRSLRHYNSSLTTHKRENGFSIGVSDLETSFTLPQLLQNNQITKLNITSNDNTFNPDTESLRVSCTNASDICILSEYVENAISLHELLDTLINSQNEEELNHTIPNIFTQIYTGLAMVRNKFTHYDLHMENVLCSTLPNKKCITMVYHVFDDELRYKTKYLVKIIDYGRSYVNISDDISSNKLYEKLMSELEYLNGVMDNVDVINTGYRWIVEPNIDDNYISYVYRNMSHDLRLLSDLLELYPSSELLPKGIQEFYNYIKKNLLYTSRFGTEEKIYREGTKPSQIPNVVAASAYLSQYAFNNKTFKDLDKEMYKDYTNIGELHIYVTSEKEMEFIPSK